MKETNFERVKDFHRSFRFDIPDKPTIPDRTTMKNRLRLIDEEYAELQEAIEWAHMGHLTKEDALKAVAKEISDLLYVVYGIGVTYGLPIDKVFAQVHDSNMTKLDDDGNPIYNEHGKAVKGPNYKPPEIDLV